MKYYIKTPITGWHEVDEEHFERFVGHIRNDSNPPNMTKDDLVKKLTKVIRNT